MKRDVNTNLISIFKYANQAGSFRYAPGALVIILLSAFILGAQEFSSGGSALPSKRDTANSAESNIKSLARVNPTTLAMEMSLPIISYPGRNGNGLSLDFRYSSNLWRQEGTHTWWLPGGSGNRQYISDVFALYAEHSAAGWTSSLLPPRLDEERATYNFMGNLYGDSVNGAILNDDFQAALYSILGQNPSLTGSACNISCATWAITVDGNGNLVRAVCAAYNYTRCSSPYDDPDPSVVPIENANNLYYVKRLRVVMSDGSTHEFRQSDDVIGNRTAFSQTVNGIQLPINNLTHPTINPANNQFTTGQGYVYDYNGNLIQDAEGRSFTFDGNDKQTEVRNASNEVVGQYYYDASGARVKKVVPSTGEVTVFVYDAGGAIAAEYSTIRETQNPTTSYLTTDHLGSPRVITDQNQNVVSRRDFIPFGEDVRTQAGDRANIVGPLGSRSRRPRHRQPPRNRAQLPTQRQHPPTLHRLSERR